MGPALVQESIKGDLIVMAHYIQFQKPINEKEMTVTVQKRLDEARLGVVWLRHVAEYLKSFQGKTITKRVVTALEKHRDTYENSVTKGYHIQLEHIASLINLIIQKGEDRESFLLGYDNNPVYDEAFLIKHNNLDRREVYIRDLEAGLKKIPELVSRYNNLLVQAQDLVKDASKVGLEFDFDIRSS